MDKTTEESSERPEDVFVRSVYEYAKWCGEPFSAVLDGMVESRFENELFVLILDRMRASSG